MANKKPEESPKARKARLEEERTSRRPVKKAVDKKEVKKAAGKDAARAAAVSANKIPSAAPKPAPKKKAAKSSPKTPADRVKKLTSDDTTKGGVEDPAFKEVYDKDRKARDLSEIGQGKAKDTLTPEQTASFNANRDADNRRRGIGEIPFSSVPKNEAPTDRKLTPRMTPAPLPTPSQEARAKAGGPSAMGIGTGNFTFNNPSKPPMRGPNVAKRSARRAKAGLEGHPGDQQVEGMTGSVNSLAVKLAARDHALAKETGKPVGGLTAEHLPPTNESIQGSHHQRLAKIIMAGVDEKKIDRLGPGTGRTREAKVSHLFEALKQHVANSRQEPVDLEGEGHTHVVHPDTKVAIPVPSLGAEQRAGLTRTAGKVTLVSQDPETAEWRLEAKTGNRQVDSTLGWDPDKPIGYVPADSHPAGTKSLVLNMPPKGRKMKTLWEHHLQTMNSDFPAPVEGDIMRRHDTSATRIVDAATGQDVPTNRLGELVRSNRTGSKGKIVGALQKTGRTTRRWKAAPDGTVQPDVRDITSRARITDESAPPTHATPGYASMYSPSGKIQPTPGGSTRITRTAEVPEVKKIATYEKPEVREKKYVEHPVTGEMVERPYKRGMVLRRFTPQSRGPVGRQFTPRDITTDEGRGVGPSDQALPGFESYGKVPEAPEAPAPAAPTQTIAEAPKPATNWKEAGIGRVPTSTVIAQGPIPAWAAAKQISYGKEKPIEGSYKTGSGTQPFPQGPSYLPGAEGAISDEKAGRVHGINFGSVRVRNPELDVRMPKTAEIAKIPGNSPVEVPREEPQAPQAPAPKVNKPKEAQPTLPGFKDYGTPSHKDGAQWIKARDLSPATKALQAKKDTKGVPDSGKTPVPRGFSVINTRSNKKR